MILNPDSLTSVHDPRLRVAPCHEWIITAGRRGEVAVLLPKGLAQSFPNFFSFFNLVLLTLRPRINSRALRSFYGDILSPALLAEDNSMLMRSVDSSVRTNRARLEARARFDSSSEILIIVLFLVSVIVKS